MGSSQQLQGRSRSEGDRTYDAECRREREADRIDTGLKPDREQGGEADGAERDRSPASDQHSHRGAGKPQYQVFGHQ